jgi:BON domain
MKPRVSFYLSVAMLVAMMAATVACTKAPNDNQIATDVQNKLSADSGLSNKQLVVQSTQGAVTLSGSVDNDAQRDAAAKYAASVAGVKQVINNLQVTPPPAAAAEQTPPPAAQESKPAPSRRRSPRKTDTSSDSNQMTQATSPPVPEPTPAPAVVPATPPPPPPPVKVSIPAGTGLAVRLEDALDSEVNQLGQTFHATLNSALTVNGDVAVPAGSEVQGHIVDVKSAGKFAGQSVLVLQLDSISSGGQSYNISTDQYKKQGSSRGKNTAEKVGAGAGIGALIGALAGGGKGAAIGAAAGGGLGGGVQAVTKGQQIKLPTETVLNFTLQSPVTVVANSKSPNSGRQQLNDNQ